MKDLVIKAGSLMLKNKIIPAVQNHREKSYLKAFLSHYSLEQSQDIETHHLDTIFNKISSSERAMELVYETYRKACLSSSRNLGPKVLGLLSAKILQEERLASPTEELVFEVCQSFNDIELRSLSIFFSSIEWSKCGEFRHGRFEHDFVLESSNGSIQVSKGDLGVNESKYLYEIEISSTSLSPEDEYAEVLSPPALESVLNRWAVKLRNLDILIERTTEVHNNFSDPDFETSIERNFYADVNKEFVETIIPLIDRATEPKF